MRILRLIVLSLLLYTGSMAHSQTNVSVMLQSHNWQRVDTALSIINADFESYKNDSLVRQSVHELFSRETQLLRGSTYSKESQGEGYGEMLLGLVSIVVRLDIRETIPNLLDWAGYSAVAFRAIVQYLKNMDSCNLSSFQEIEDRFKHPGSNGQWVKHNLLRIVSTYFAEADSVCPEAKTVFRDMILQQLRAETYYERELAVGCCVHFLDDPRLLLRIKLLARNDSYSRVVNGKKAYPIRVEAQRILDLAKKKQ